jgi:hypothetical protein
MRDAAGELADGLHLLRLRELDLEVFLLGDIDKMEGKPTRRVPPEGGGAVRDIVETAEKQDHRLVTGPFGPDLDRLGICAPVSRCRESGSDAVAIAVIQQGDQLLSLQNLRGGTE